MHHFSWVFLLRLTACLPACPGPPKELKYPDIHASGPCTGCAFYQHPWKNNCQFNTTDHSRQKHRQPSARGLEMNFPPGSARKHAPCPPQTTCPLRLTAGWMWCHGPGESSAAAAVFLSLTGQIEAEQLLRQLS